MAKVGLALVTFWLFIGLALHSALPHPTVMPAICEKIGVGLFDTLVVLADGGPQHVDTMPEAELLHHNIGWAPRDSNALFLATWFPRVHIDIDTVGHGWTERHWTERVELSRESMRGVAVHEYGHWLEYSQPKLFGRFLAVGARLKTGGFAAEETAKWMQSEMFADAFAIAVGRRLTNATIIPYQFSPAFTTEAQQRLLDTWVTDRWSAVP